MCGLHSKKHFVLVSKSISNFCTEFCTELTYPNIN